MNIRKRLIVSFTLCGITPIILLSAVNMAISNRSNVAIRGAVENNLSSEVVAAVSEQAGNAAFLTSTAIMLIAGLIVTMYAYVTVNQVLRPVHDTTAMLKDIEARVGRGAEATVAVAPDEPGGRVGPREPVGGPVGRGVIHDEDLQPVAALSRPRAVAFQARQAGLQQRAAVVGGYHDRERR